MFESRVFSLQEGMEKPFLVVLIHSKSPQFQKSSSVFNILILQQSFKIKSFTKVTLKSVTGNEIEWCDALGVNNEHKSKEKIFRKRPHLFEDEDDL